MSTVSEINLSDIPDLTSLLDYSDRPEPLQDGWYQGTILEKREFTDNNGNERVFESSDAPANKSGRNIRLQVELTRKSDGRKFNISTIVNYQPSDLTAATVSAIAARKAETKETGENLGDLFRPYMSLTRIAKLQQIAGVRQFKPSAEGGLDISPLFGKVAFFRVRPDNRNPQYKEIADYQTEAPRKAAVL